MGLFGSIGGFFSGAAKSIVQTVTSPAKLTTAIATGGASVVAPRTFSPLTGAIQSTLYNPRLIGPAAQLALPGVGGRVASLVPQGGNMGLNLGNFLPGAIQGLSSLFTGGSPSTALNAFTTALPSYGGFGQTQLPAAIPVQQRQPITPGTNAMATLGRMAGKFWDKFPNLYRRLQIYKLSGIKLTRARLWSMVKRFGPDFLITAGILTAIEINELMLAGPGHRRMNPANGRALKRSLRRLESFERLCHRVDRSLHSRRGGRRTKGVGSRSTTLIRQG